MLKEFSPNDWCPGGRSYSVSDETDTWDKLHVLDEAERVSVERLCRWTQEKGVYSLDMVECYATHCDNPNTTVNELFNYDLQWSLEAESPMTPVTEKIRYPCKAGTRLVDKNLWWKGDAPTYDDIYCGLDGEYQYPDTWFYCFPGQY